MKIETISKQDIMSSVAQRWSRQYPGRDRVLSCGRTAGEIEAALASAKSEAEVAEIVGNGSWTRIKCDCCGNSVAKAVLFDADEGDEYSRNMTICEPCLRIASELMNLASSK